MPPSSDASINPCQHIPSSWKLVLTTGVIVTSSLIPLENWPALGLLLALVLIGLSFANVSIAYLVRRLAMFLPVLLVFGLSMPISQWSKDGVWSWTMALWLRCIVAFLAGLWLIHAMPFSELLTTLVRWRCPALLVAMLSFMYRYIFILWDELARLRHARDARDFGEGTMLRRWTGNAQLIGLLLLRAMERAERIHRAMLARGWDGSVRFLGDDPRAAR